MRTRPVVHTVFLAALLSLGAGCASQPNGPATSTTAAPATATSSTAQAAREPSAAQRAFMSRLTVAHHFDPATGFIVADEVTPLPAVLRDAPTLAVAAEQARREGRTLVAFTTADRCAPCQQFKRDALQDPRVVALLAESGSGSRFIAVHVEVDRDGVEAQRILGSTAIPASHAVRPDGSVERLPGMRSADDLLAWLNAL